MAVLRSSFETSAVQEILAGEVSQVSYEIRDLHVLDEFTHRSTHQKKIDTTPTIGVRTFFVRVTTIYKK